MCKYCSNCSHIAKSRPGTSLGELPEILACCKPLETNQIVAGEMDGLKYDLYGSTQDKRNSENGSGR
jgi:hypothetical protein